MEVALESIRPSPYQPRLVFQIEDLKTEIERDGLLSELVVREHDGFYELVDGERRWRVLKELGWNTAPVRVINIDDRVARRSVFKLNRIRANYTVEEEARYFRKLADEGMTAYEIGKELNVDDNWVRAHLNVFKLPEDIQKAVWANKLAIGHIRDLEPIIGANVQEATEIANEIILRGLSRQETQKLLRPQIEGIEKARVKAAQEAIGARAPIGAKLETPEDFEKAAEALRKEAKRKREEAMTPEQIAALEAEKRQKAQERERKKQEERIRLQEAERRRIEEEAREKAKGELMRDPQFIRMVREAKIEKLLSQPRKQIYVALPEGKYRTIVIDPPWPIEKILRDVRPNQLDLDYPTMTIAEIKTLPIPELAYEDGCHIYLWTTHKYLPRAFEVLDAWGANYECLLTWVKNVGMTPFSWMYSTEHCLFARIGNLPLLKLGKRLDFQAKVREHSRKPDEFYNLVKDVSPEPRIDMFSREQREGFAQYGNELDRFRSKQVSVID